MTTDTRSTIDLMDATADVVGTWLQLVAVGDRNAFAHVYDQLSTRVFSLALRVTANRALAEEVLQETFLDVWRRADAFDPRRGKGSSWVFTLTHRRAVDCVRHTQASSTRDHQVGMRNIEIDHDSVTDQIHRRADARQLRTALSGLSPRQRSFLSMAYYGGHSHSEIAALTGTPVGTVKSSIRNGLTALRKTLATAA